MSSLWEVHIGDFTTVACSRHVAEIIEQIDPDADRERNLIVESKGIFITEDVFGERDGDVCADCNVVEHVIAKATADGYQIIYILVDGTTTVAPAFDRDRADWVLAGHGKRVQAWSLLDGLYIATLASL